VSYIADYSWARPSAAAMKELGIIGVIRYLGPGNRGRDITAAEVAQLHRDGLGVGLVWETTTHAALAGWQAGHADLTAANRHADALGYPAHMPLFYACDTDVTPHQIRGPVADTFRGAIQASRRPVRPYGEADVLDILCGEMGLMPCGWQCMAWSRGRMSPHRCMYQLYPPALGDQIDLNEIGPHPTDFLWHPSIPFDTTPKDWFDMATLDELRTIVREEVAHGIGALENVQGNLAGVTRGEGAETRSAGHDEGEHTRQLITDLDAGDLVELESVQSNLAGVLREAQANGTITGTVDVDALAAKVAASLTIATKPAEPSGA